MFNDKPQASAAMGHAVALSLIELCQITFTPLLNSVADFTRTTTKMSEASEKMTELPIVGCLLGTAVGDALGLPYEGVSRRRLNRLLGSPDRHRFMLGRGMVSDDTEHTCIVAQSLITSNFDIDIFTKDFARRLR